MNVFLARQPIYDAERKIHGYELLFRRADTTEADVRDGTVATAQVLLNAAIDIGVDRIAGDELLFINCTREILMSEPIIPPDRCVLEILESVDLDCELLERVEALRRRGYRIALDDFTLEGKLAAAVPLADYIKLDVLALLPAELKRHATLRQPGLRLIAEKIDCEALMEQCVNLGFDLFQGYFLRKPDTVKGAHLPTSKLAALRLIGICQDPDASAQDVSATVSADLSMTYSLLRLANSALFGRSRPIRSVQAVVTWMGTEYLARWGTLLALASEQGCPVSYLGTALQRGYMCESLAAVQGGVAPGSSFLVGLLSTLDSILDVPMAQILEQVRLSGDIREALELHSGALGHLLACALAYEAGDTGALDCSGVHGGALYDAYWQSIEQAESTLRELAALRT
ncbi:MAG TPA: HDOD domain-containing protein [Bryobacteraceae bacterium]|nr:HDOD domain-containing protein [Bryobacteraceae bacterium]